MILVIRPPGQQTNLHYCFLLFFCLNVMFFWMVRSLDKGYGISAWEIFHCVPFRPSCSWSS